MAAPEANMTTNILVEIIQECMLIDRLTVEFYNRLSASAANPSLKRFWDNLANEGGAHLGYWNQLLLQANTQDLPQVFDDPLQVKTELQARAENMKSLINESEPNLPAGRAFNLAYRLESYKLHPAFRTLFRNFNTLVAEPVPERLEDATIARFSEVLRKQSAVTPELKTIADTLQVLWEQNRFLAGQSTIDEVSLLHNRRGFLIVATQQAFLAKRNNKPVAILMTDFTDIKRIVEGRGRPRENDVVRKASATLKKILRGSDLIGRYNADTFIALLPDTPMEGGQIVAQKIQREVRKIIPATADAVISTVVVQGNITDDVETELLELIRQAEYKLLVTKSGTVM
jgi:diguanylate cyclase (GGDEF)-like protein